MVNKVSDCKIRNYCLITYSVVPSFQTNLLIHTYIHAYMHTHMKIIMLKTDTQSLRILQICFFFLIILLGLRFVHFASLSIFWLRLDWGLKPEISMWECGSFDLDRVQKPIWFLKSVFLLQLTFYHPAWGACLDLSLL